MIGNKITKNKRGFTLVELLVSVALFAITVSAASSLFSAAAKAQRRSFENQKVLENGRYVLETIAKAVRMGEIKTVTSGNTLQICHPTKGDTDESTCNTSTTGYKLITYDLNLNRVRENTTDISSSNVLIDRLYFNVSGVDADPQNKDTIQPRATIILRVKSLGSIAFMYSVEVNFQTTISQRNLDSQ